MSHRERRGEEGAAVVIHADEVDGVLHAEEDAREVVPPRVDAVCGHDIAEASWVDSARDLDDPAAEKAQQQRRQERADTGQNQVWRPGHR